MENISPLPIRIPFLKPIKNFTIVYNYMRDTWGIDLNELRKIVLRRQQEITEIDLSTIQ